MSVLYGNAVVGQSGGPTAAINATLAGVIEGALQAQKDGVIENLYGMKNGIEGFLSENFINLTDIFKDGEGLKTLKTTPAAALGSCRKKLGDIEKNRETYEKIIEVLEKHNIRYFFYIGGNDSMDTVLQLSRFAKEKKYDMCVVGVPKTIDNDLAATDHTPGFGSAAKYIATTVKEILRDVSVYTLKAVTVVEIMGRDAGWLTAASALPKISGGLAPDLIYLPEKTFDIYKFTESVKEKLEEHPAVLVAVSEGVKLANGKYLGEGIDEGKVDAFGHKQLSGAGKTLELMLKDKLGCKVRSIELNLPQRCAGHLISKTDIDESVRIGNSAVRFAIEGKTGIMVTLVRKNSENYLTEVSYADIADIANAVRRVPDEYITESGDGITDEGIRYLTPLIMGEAEIEYENGLPKHIVL
jgi:6-phosphofructokinase 1